MEIWTGSIFKQICTDQLPGTLQNLHPCCSLGVGEQVTACTLAANTAQAVVKA